MNPRRHRRERRPVAHPTPSRYLDGESVILSSARKRGIPDSEIEHAWRNPARVIGEQEDGMVIVIGPDTSGRLLELGVVESRDLPGILLIAHAMPARTKFLN